VYGRIVISTVCRNPGTVEVGQALRESMKKYIVLVMRLPYNLRLRYPQGIHISRLFLHRTLY
jgi:hypothetical protein